ncbi:MAG: metallophosphoesterase [Candidatus Woesearchaeota archaeon]
MKNFLKSQNEVLEILESIYLFDLSVFIKNSRTLVISDLQLGYEEALNKKGFLIPRFQDKDIFFRLGYLIERLKPSLVIINGDIKHEFSVISKTEWTNVKKLIDFIMEKTNLVLIKGNHDNMLEPIAKTKNIDLLEYYYDQKNKIYITHGDKIDTNNFINEANNIIIGHEHPAIGLREKGRVEKFKCFLKGKFKIEYNKEKEHKKIKTENEKNLIVLPSFNTITEGTDILQEKLMSPFLKNIDDFEVFLINDLLRERIIFEKKNIKENINEKLSEILYFGKVKSLINQLH